MPPCFLKKNKSSILTRVIQGICGTSFTLLFALFIFFLSPSSANAAVNIPLTINLSETVNVTGTPRIAVDVGGTTRYATYSSGTGSNTLTFTLSPQAGDVDLDGVTVSSPIDLNGGTIKDVKGNNATLTFTPPSTTNVKVNYPSLGMDFVYDADGRYTLNGTVYNDLTSFLSAAGGTFTRASIGTYFDSTGTLQTAASGVPRFDYDPATHVAKGLLIEESRTNLLKYSEQFDNAIWTKNLATVTPDTILDLNGSTHADKIIETATTGQHFIYQSGGVASVNTSFTVFVKAAGRTRLRLQLTSAGNGCYANIDLASGTISGATIGSGGTYISSSISAYPNGWYKVNLIGTYSASFSAIILLQAPSGVDTYAGDGSSGVYVWGAQLEQGAFATSYIPTTTAAVIRAADNLTIPTGGWFSLTKGSFFIQSEIFGGSANGRFVTGIGTDTNNYIGFPYVVSNSISSLYYRASGSGPVLDGTPTLSFNTPFKSGAAYSTTTHTISYAKNGTLSATGTSVNAMASASTLYIGTSPYSPANITSGYYQKFKYYPTRVTDTQLQLLTQ